MRSLLFLSAAIFCASPAAAAETRPLTRVDVSLLPEKTAVLAFADAPGPSNGAILEALAAKRATALFFIDGQAALADPAGLAAIVDAGHELGNATAPAAAGWRAGAEANLTRFILEKRTGRAARLSLTPAARHIPVAATPADTRMACPAEGDTAARILLFPSDGVTAGALPALLDCLAARGFRTATVAEGLGLDPAVLSPPAGRTSAALGGIAVGLVELLRWGHTAARAFIVVMLVALFVRLAVVLIGSHIQARRKNGPPRPDVPVTIVVPAHNEGPVIEPALRSLLASRHDAFRVLVVDDGSTDDTAARAERIAADDPRLTVIRKENGGKASALNAGIARVETPFVVAVDADTFFPPETLARICRHFADPAVGAVAGNTKVANRDRLLTRMQSLEYIVALNFDRRTTDLLNCILIVPGAIGAFRMEALRGAGGFATDSLAEDADLTMTIREAGWRIVYDAEAIAKTEAPSTVRDLLKQRIRWSTGMLQICWKHRYAFFRPKYGTLGMIGMPYFVFYQLLFLLLAPFYDALLLWWILSGDWHTLTWAFGVYGLLDVFLAMVALRLDHEKLREAWLVLPQRFLYRQIISYVIYVSLFRAIRGSIGGWGHLQRQGTHLR